LLQYHVTSRSFIASQQAYDGGIFGPSFWKNGPQWVSKALLSPPHSVWAEISNTKMLAMSNNVAKPKNLVAMVIKILVLIISSNSKSTTLDLWE
jgi:hypothetical protein